MAKFGQDIRIDHDNDPSIIADFVKDIRGASRGFIRGLTTDLIGAPSDILSLALRTAGIDIPDENVLGSQHLRRLTGQPKIDSPPEAFGNVVSTAINPTTLGVKGVALVGILARPAQKAAEEAQRLFAKGATESTIFKETGVTIAPSHNMSMRRQISDEDARLTDASSKFIKTPNLSAQVYPNAENFLKHHNLYNDGVLGERLKKTRIRISKSGKDTDSVYGEWSYDTDTIHVKAGNKASNDDIVAVTLHEMQHKVQDLQGLEQGANNGDILRRLDAGKLTPAESKAALAIQGSNLEFQNEDIADIIYWTMAGEVEARAVQNHYKLPKSLLPPTFDVRLSTVLDRGEELAADTAIGINNSIILDGNVK